MRIFTFYQVNAVNFLLVMVLIINGFRGKMLLSKAWLSVWIVATDSNPSVLVHHVFPIGKQQLGGMICFEIVSLLLLPFVFLPNVKRKRMKKCFLFSKLIIQTWKKVRSWYLEEKTESDPRITYLQYVASR